MVKQERNVDECSGKKLRLRDDASWMESVRVEPCKDK